MIYNFLSVYGIYYPSGTIETRAKWRIYTLYIPKNERYRGRLMKTQRKAILLHVVIHACQTNNNPLVI